MICRHCGREIEVVHARGSLYDDDMVTVHVDTQLTVCDGRVIREGGYFEADHAEPVS